MVISTTFAAAQSYYDVCIVGTGPAGLAMALDCEKRGLSVLLVEGGGNNPSKKEALTFNDNIVDDQTHVSLQEGARRCFGGTSWAWGGLCVPFEPIDLEKRRHVPYSGWPITRDHLTEWYRAAASFFGFGSAPFEGDELMPDADAGVTSLVLGYIPAQPNLAIAYRQHVAQSKQIFCCLNAPVRGIRLSADGRRVDGLRLGLMATAESLPKAGSYVIAAGGVETTRLLLAAQRCYPGFCGGPDGPLGRFYMGHIAGQIASVIFHDRTVASKFLYSSQPNGAFSQRRFSIGNDTQKREGLLNTDFILRLPPAADSRHRSGALSLLHLFSRTPAGSIFRDSKKLQYVIPMLDRTVGNEHVYNVLTNPVSVIADTGNLLTQFRRRHMPVLFSNSGNVYSLRYHAEHAPSPDSRIVLSEEAGDDLSIDFRYGASEISSVIRSHDILDRALRSADMGCLEYFDEPQGLEALVRAQARDGYHQIGTTRMGTSPADSVVNADCRVHGVDNLYVASSSTFPTSGAANPTFTIVSLALRLADHLAKQCGRKPRVSRQKPTYRSAASETVPASVLKST